MPTELKQSVLRRTNAFFGKLEEAWADGSDRPLTYRPIFILGPPRSGSTLLYECCIHRFGMGYLSNIHQTFFEFPSIVERLFYVTRWRRQAGYRSTRGVIAGIRSPSEAGKFWYRFFREKPQYVPIEEVDPVRMRAMRGVIRSFGNVCRRPIVLKNLPCGLRLAPLAKYLPEALFIVLHREKYAVARSILAARMDRYGDYRHWWSLETPNFKQLAALPPEEQVVKQIESICHLIEEGRRQMGKERFLDLHYEDFCADTHDSLARIGQFLNKHGVFVTARGSVPANFPSVKAPEIDSELLESLERLLGGEHGRQVPGEF